MNKVLHPSEVSVALGRDAELPAHVVVFAEPVGDVFEEDEAEADVEAFFFGIGRVTLSSGQIWVCVTAANTPSLFLFQVASGQTLYVERCVR